MYYPFPHISNISDVLPAIAGRDEFVVAVKPEGYTVINYFVNFVDTFPRVLYDRHGEYLSEQDKFYAIRRECRGIKFDTATGNIICRPYHKFFNVNEKEETQIHEINLQSQHRVLAKLDGSMITPFMVQGEVRYGTKMGVTEVSGPVEEFARKHPFYSAWSRHLLAQNLTPIFEWTSRKQRIVIDYPEDRLVLTAVRNMITGEYIDFTDFDSFGPLISFKFPECNGEVPIVEHFDEISDLADFIETNRSASGIEGWVLRFHDGHCVKIKTDEYVKIHKAKEGLRFEKDVLELVMTEKLDDIKPYLSGAELENINRYESDVWRGLLDTAAFIETTFAEAKAKYGDDRKAFAVEFATKQPALLKPFYFDMFAGNDIKKSLIETVKHNTGTQTMVDSVRALFKATWIN